MPITDTELAGLPGMASFWRPTREELACLNAGKAVVLIVAGYAHPPVFVGVEA